MSRLITLAILFVAVLVIAAGELAAVGPPAAAEGDRQKVVYLGDAGPVLIELRVRLDGRSFRAANRDLMNALFDHLDRDGDGVLSAAEMADAPPASALGNTFGFRGAPTFVGGRPKAKGKEMTREALAAHYRGTGLAPFQLSYSPRDTGLRLFRPDGRLGGQGSNGEQINARLYELLDADKDGKLSRQELAAAPGRLKKLDVDEDEMLTTDELLGDARPAGDGDLVVFDGRGPMNATPANPTLFAVGDGPPDAALTRALAAKYGKAAKLPAKAALTLTVRLGKRSDKEPMVEVTSRGQLPPGVRVEKLPGRAPLISGNERRVAVDGVWASQAGGVALVLGNSRLELGGPGATNDFRFTEPSVAAQYKAQFQMADADGNGYVDKQEAAKSNFFRGTFAAMDRDGDGKLFEKEMLAYVNKMGSLGQLAARGCVTLTVTNQGQGLFELFDADKDGRLSVRELRGLGKVLGRLDADKDGALAKGEVPTNHRGAFELGPAGGGGNLRRVAFIAGGMPAPALPMRTEGPLWFRKMDRNGDGDVSRAEFLGTDAQFQAIDADGDGLISAAEAEAHDRRAKTSKE